MDAPDVLELLAKVPYPDRARKLTRAQVSAARKRARCRNIADRATAILAALRGGQLAQPPVLTAVYAATGRAVIAVIATLNEQVKVLQGQVKENFGQHPDAEIYVGWASGRADAHCFCERGLPALDCLGRASGSEQLFDEVDVERAEERPSRTSQPQTRTKIR